ncbi:MAG: PAS domain S-box protein, partial [Spirochaetota bacterium]
QEKQARLISALKSESKSRRYLERIITNITDPLVVTDRQGVIVMVNRAMESLTGRVKSHLIGKHVGTLLVQKDRDGMIDGTLSKGEPIEAEVRFISKENKEIPAVFSMSPISDGIDKDIKGFVGVAKDITIRKRIEAALAVMANNNNVSSGEKNRTDDRVGLLWKETVKRNEADIALLDSYRFLQTIIDSVDDEVIVRNIENQVVMLNVSARKRKQLLANSNASCMNVLDGCTYPCDECGNGDIESVVRSIGKTVFFERIYTTGDFKYIYEVSASPLYGDDGKLVGIVEVGRDVTKRRELERDVIHVYESERQRIGQDLHDDLMQNLIGIDVLLKMAVHSMKNKYSDLDENNEDSIRLKEISHFLENTISKSRRLARGLCPVDLGAGNFIPAVRQMVEESAGIYGIECSLDICSEAFHFDDITARHLFYIIREAVTNARKHSKATKINISMKMNDGLLKLEVMDNGKGFGNGIGSQDGLGMRIMRYRADMIGAQLIINSGNEGTSIACIVGVKGGNNENKMEG